MFLESKLHCQFLEREQYGNQGALRRPRIKSQLVTNQPTALEEIAGLQVLVKEEGMGLDQWECPRLHSRITPGAPETKQAQAAPLGFLTS